MFLKALANSNICKTQSIMIIITMLMMIIKMIAKTVKFFLIINLHPLKNSNGNDVATDKTNDSNITFRSKKSKTYNKIDNKNNNNYNNSNSNNNEHNSNNKSSNDNKINSTSSSSTSKETVFILGDRKKIKRFSTNTKTEP